MSKILKWFHRFYLARYDISLDLEVKYDLTGFVKLISMFQHEKILEYTLIFTMVQYSILECYCSN